METTNEEEPINSEKEEKKKNKKQLQWERFRTAFERLQLAWIRTCLTLLMIGVGAYEYFYNRLEAGKAPLLKSSITGRDLGLFLIFTSFFMLLLATLQHLKSMADLKKHVPSTRYSVATLLSFLILALTLFLGVMVFIKL
jgi:uncharacterized membrane protein YidH (DUF202 family)